MSSSETLAASELWSVGEVASRLGLPASTLRTWERRYGVGPSARSAGGHRRYVASDFLQLEHMAELVSQGVSAAEAARLVHSAATEHDGHPLVQRDPEESSPFSDAVIVAAREFDSAALREMFDRAIDELGVVAAWETRMSPALRRVGLEWSAGVIGVGGEHLVSDCLVTVLRAHAHDRMSGPTQHRSVLLASAEDDQHALPLLALQCALAEEGVHCHVLGARTPASSIAGITLRLAPAAVFLWASLPRNEGDTLSRVVAAAAERTTVLLGGPGWIDLDVGTAQVVDSLTSAVEAVRDSLAES